MGGRSENGGDPADRPHTRTEQLHVEGVRSVPIMFLGRIGVLAAPAGSALCGPARMRRVRTAG